MAASVPVTGGRASRYPWAMGPLSLSLAREKKQPGKRPRALRPVLFYFQIHSVFFLILDNLIVFSYLDFVSEIIIDRL
jgi:hypothetical protein